jgi:membrane protein DedA with SNARE-associated domain
MDHILVLVEQYGYLIVFLGVMLESAGVPIPGDPILIASGILAHQGRPKPPACRVSCRSRS